MMKEFFDWRERQYPYDIMGVPRVCYEKSVQFMLTRRYVEIDCEIHFKKSSRYVPSHLNKWEQNLKADINIKGSIDSHTYTVEETCYTNEEAEVFVQNIKNEVDQLIQTYKVADLLENI